MMASEATQSPLSTTGAAADAATASLSPLYTPARSAHGRPVAPGEPRDGHHTGRQRHVQAIGQMVGQVPGQDEHMPSVEAGGTRQPGSM